MYQNILIALDGSPTSNLALQEALKIADVGTKIIAISVVENPLQGYIVMYDYEKVHDELLEHSKNILEQAVEVVKKHGHIQLETHIIDINPNSSYDVSLAIEHAATQYHADLIVIGTHGRRGVHRFFFGSIAEQLIRQSHLPVLLVRNQSINHS